jgi:hypothetical protein
MSDPVTKPFPRGTDETFITSNTTQPNHAVTLDPSITHNRVSLN